MNDLSGGPVLSAIARRKAAQLKTSSSSEISSEVLLTADAPVVAVDELPTLPLKRKSSARSLKQLENFDSSKTEAQLRKRSKPQRYFHGPSNKEEPLTSTTPRREYSPSRPLVDSSDEDTAPTLNETDTPLGEIDEDEDMTFRARAPKFSGNIFVPVEGQTLFSLSPEDTSSVTKQSMATRVLLLQPSDSLIFVGTTQLMLLQGSIELLGVLLTPSKKLHRIFAPRSHPLPIISAPYAQKGEQINVSPVKAALFHELPDHIRKFVSPEHSVVLLQESPTGVEGLGDVVRPFKNVFEPDARDAVYSSSVFRGFHILKTEPQNDAVFYLPHDWETAMNRITSPTSDHGSNISNGHEHDAPVVLVRGGKNSGKSTFSRTLANRLTNSYQRVAFIECDLGQSEFTPGGMVSLNVLTSPIFGPPFTHLSLPRCAHFVGGNSPRTSPSHYLSALSDLAQRYHLELKYSTAFDDEPMFDHERDVSHRISTTIPLVINTQGWVKGMGADLLRSIEGIFKPSHIVDFQLPGVTSVLDAPLNRRTLFGETIDPPSSNVSTNIVVAAISPPLRPPRFSAADLRGLALISYFHGCFNSREKKPESLDDLVSHWDTSLPLRAIAPITIDMNLGLESIVIAAPSGDDIVPAELSNALICGVVGLVTPESTLEPPATTYVRGALPPSPQASRCVGLAFVRDISDMKLQVLTPTPARELKHCRIAVLGELNMPVWAFLNQDGDETEEGGLPYLQWGRSIAESAGGERRRIRRNIMRRGQA
ncbi:hypothetical protein BDV93DRAFT_541952 [Ceratobasidium sp. AG-I]|nr:hypothetical protein BDV93DRAFT_541952 [Ceratobasidium sp. AG-I]